MINNPESAEKVAEFLLQIKAIQLNPESPFHWASGWQSPIYCDNRKTLSYPQIRTYIRQQFTDQIIETYGKPDVIAGVATGGIAIGALVAQEMGVPFVYVRASSKGHGLQNRIEGVLESGQDVVVIEDLISTGGSSLSAVEAIRETGAKVKGLAAIFTYGFELAKDGFAKAKCPYFTLCDYGTLIEHAVENEYVSDDHLASLMEWRMAPSEWKKND